MSKSRMLAWKEKSKRNRHTGHINAFKRGIITSGEHFESHGRNYFRKHMRNVQVDIGNALRPNLVIIPHYTIVRSDRRV